MMGRSAKAFIAVHIVLGAFACGRVDREADADEKCGAPMRDPEVLAPEVERPRPEQNFWHTDPALGGCLARVSDHRILPEENTLQAAVGRQAFSPDGTLVLASSGVVVDTADFSPVAKLPNAPAVWAPDREHVVYFTEVNALYRHDVDRDLTELVESFDEYSTLDSHAGLREPSADGSSIALVGVRPSDGVHEVFVWDFARGEKSKPVAGPIDHFARVTSPNWASVSPSGHWVVVGWPDSGDAAFHGIELYDAAMSFRRRASTGAGAADLAIDSRREEWLVEWSPAEHGPGLRKVRLGEEDDKPKTLIELDGFSNVRISCRSPGTDACAVSTHGNLNGPWRPLQDEVFVVQLDGSADAPRVERLAHHESAPEFVAAQPLATCGLSPDAVLPNPVLARDARSVLFTSNWNAHCYGELYLAVR